MCLNDGGRPTKTTIHCLNLWPAPQWVCIIESRTRQGVVQLTSRLNAINGNWAWWNAIQPQAKRTRILAAVFLPLSKTPQRNICTNTDIIIYIYMWCRYYIFLYTYTMSAKPFDRMLLRCLQLASCHAQTQFNMNELSHCAQSPHVTRQTPDVGQGELAELLASFCESDWLFEGKQPELKQASGQGDVEGHCRHMRATGGT